MENQDRDQHGNKHVKAEVKYIGFDELFHHTYDQETKVLQVKKEAMEKFKITASPNQYCLQYGDAVLNDSLTLAAAGIPSGEQATRFDLIAREKNDVDGGHVHA